MNDDEVNGISEPPYDHRNAYMLFYMRDSDSLETAVAQATATLPEGPSKSFSSIGKKRAREDDDIEEDIGKPVRQALFSIGGAGPSNPIVGKKVSGMLPKQDRQAQLSCLAKPSLARPPHNQLPDSEDSEVESPHQKKARLNLGVTFDREKDRVEGKKKKKKKLPQGNIVKLSSLSLSGKRPSLDLTNVSSDHEEEEPEASDLANKAVIFSTPPLPPSTSSPTAAIPPPSKKRKLVEYSSGGENGATDSNDADGDHRSKRSKASSSASSCASSSSIEREREDGISSDRVPNSMFAPSSSSTQQSPQLQLQQNVRHKKPRMYWSRHKQDRRKSFSNPFAMAGHQAGGFASIGAHVRRRPGGI